MEDRPFWSKHPEYLRPEEDSCDDETDRPGQAQPLHQPGQGEHEEQAQRKTRKVGQMISEIHKNLITLIETINITGIELSMPQPFTEYCFVEARNRLLNAN
jgi:hypothetical protein